MSRGRLSLVEDVIHVDDPIETKTLRTIASYVIDRIDLDDESRTRLTEVLTQLSPIAEVQARFGGSGQLLLGPEGS